MSNINASRIMNRIKSSVNNRINGLVTSAQNGGLSEESIEKSFEPYQKKLDAIEQASNAYSTAKDVYAMFKDPVGTAKDKAKDMMLDLAKDAIANSETVQNLKKEIISKAEEKIGSLPQVQNAKGEIDRIAGNLAQHVKDPDIPEANIQDAPSAEALVAAAIRDSRLARLLLKGEQAEADTQ